jgi:hypothetical protein
MSNLSHINEKILVLAKETGAEVTLTGSTYRGRPSRNQALLNGRFVGFYAQEAFGGNGTDGWQLGSGRIKGSREQAAHFIRTGELPVDGVVAPRKALPAAKKEPAETQTQLSALVNPTVDTALARLQLVKELKAVGISDELIAAALKG